MVRLSSSSSIHDGWAYPISAKTLTLNNANIPAGKQHVE